MPESQEVHATDSYVKVRGQRHGVGLPEFCIFPGVSRLAGRAPLLAEPFSVAS